MNNNKSSCGTHTQSNTTSQWLRREREKKILNINLLSRLKMPCYRLHETNKPTNVHCVFVVFVRFQYNLFLLLPVRQTFTHCVCFFVVVCSHIVFFSVVGSIPSSTRPTGQINKQTLGGSGWQYYNGQRWFACVVYNLNCPQLIRADSTFMAHTNFDVLLVLIIIFGS